MAQRWQDLLMAHWPVPATDLQPLLPPGLELDTYAGQSWVSIVPFRMSGVRVRMLPPLPKLSTFPQLNLRTYVTRDGLPGIWLFSSNVGDPLSVAVARRLYYLPYFVASASILRQGETVHYTSIRTHAGAPPAVFAATYQPAGPAREAEAGSLDGWLTARSYLYAADTRGALYRARVDHIPWSLQPATASITVNTLAQACGLTLPDREPLLHFSRSIDVRAWWRVRLTG